MIKRIAVQVLALAMVAGSLATLAACNTMAGAGEDIQRAGAAIERKAKK